MKGQIADACFSGDLVTLKELITPRTVNDVLSPDLTALNMCCIYNQASCVKFLVEDMKCDELLLGLEYAFEVRSFHCAQILLNYIVPTRRWGRILSYSIRYIRLLLEAGVRPNLNTFKIAVSEYSECAKLFMQYGARLKDIEQAPIWAYDYEKELDKKKEQWRRSVIALVGVGKRKRAPKDLWKWMINRTLKNFYK